MSQRKLSWAESRCLKLIAIHTVENEQDAMAYIHHRRCEWLGSDKQWHARLGSDGGIRTRPARTVNGELSALRDAISWWQRQDWIGAAIWID
jgi:hypothetical protein